jgi:hypothetical protein
VRNRMDSSPSAQNDSLNPLFMTPLNSPISILANPGIILCQRGWGISFLE